MSTYKEINGQKVQSLASDPPAPYTGQIWYNSSTNLLRARRGAVVSGWSSGGTMSTSRNAGAASTFGTPTATIAFAGADPSSAYVSATESYNGSWTTLPYNLGALSYQCGGAGTSTSALKFGGANYVTPPTGQQNTTQVWSGSGWTSGPTMASNSSIMGSAGTSNTSALSIGGFPDSGGTPSENRCQIYNGAWTFGNNKNTRTRGSMGAGTATSALNAGGYDQQNPPSYKAYTESFNGTTWTSVADINTGRAYGAGCGVSNTASIIIGGGGGGAGSDQKTESWNGTSWTVESVLPKSTQRNMASGNGSTTALSFGGNEPTSTSTYEFLVGTAVQTNTIPTS